MRSYTLLFITLSLFLLTVNAIPGRLNARVVENGSHIDRNGDKITITQPNYGNISLIMQSGGPAKRDTGWITSTWTFATMTYFSAQWRVPAAPATNAGNNVIFYFNSFESSSFNDILQPVLQFNNIIGGWSLASWYGDPSGNYYHSDPVSVAPGDNILGIISLSNNVWSILGYVNGVLRTTITVSYNTVGQQANGQFALEVYNVDTCSKYPPTNSIYATNIVLMNGGSTITPSWSNNIWSNGCNAGAYANTNANGVQLTWNSGSTTPASHPASIGIDLVGGDLVQGTAASALECAQQCDNTANCVGWVWGNPAQSGCSGFNNKCWLKSTVTTRSPNTCLESGVKVGETGIDRVGGDLPGMPLSLGPAATAATCASACKDNSACVSWAFNTPSCGGSTCWLKGTIPPRSSNGCRISGVKGNVGIDRSGNDIAGSPIALPNDATPTTCANRCASTSGCVAWAMVNPQSGCETVNNCWLKSATGTTSSQGCRISGVMG